MRVLFLDEVHEVLAERLTDAGFDCEFALTEDLDTCRSMAQYADGLVIRLHPSMRIMRVSVHLLHNSKVN